MEFSAHVSALNRRNVCVIYKMQRDYRERSAALERREKLISKGEQYPVDESGRRDCECAYHTYSSEREASYLSGFPCVPSIVSKAFFEFL